jgi:hypothetical protein
VRERLRFTDLKHLPNDTIALVAVPNTNDTAHYYVVAPTKKGTALIDVPLGVAVVSDIPLREINLLEERLASQGGIVLFVQSSIAKRTSATADTISISPAEHNLGEFLIDPTVPPFRPQFEIKNTSSTPVAIEIQTSCGCVASSNWKSKIIDAKGKAVLEFEISPLSWVVGTKTEQILLKFPDSSSKIISITGTGHGGEGTQTMKLDVPSALVLDIGSNDARGFFQTMSRNVVLSSENNDALSVNTDATWLNVEISKNKDTVSGKDVPQRCHYKHFHNQDTVTR